MRTIWTRADADSGKRRRRLLAAAAVAGALAVTTGVAAKRFGPWSAPVSAEQGSHPELNTAFNDGCPILSPDGLSLYQASNRPGGLGNIDIWVSTRRNTRSGWGAPVNLGAPINGPTDDFCPTPIRGKGLFFVSRRDEPNGDIYFARQTRNGWQGPFHLGANINSSAQEWSPAYFVNDHGQQVLYFSSTRAGGPGGQDIYFSADYGPAQLAPGALNTPFDDSRPNVRRDGKEIVFDSTRPGTLGATDIWSSTRASTSDPWPEAVHLGSTINSAAGESRASPALGRHLPAVRVDASRQRGPGRHLRLHPPARARSR